MRKKGKQKFDAATRTEFLRLMKEESLSITEAAKRVGVTQATVSMRMHRYPKFKAKVNKAREAFIDRLEEKLGHMALDGNVAAIFGTLKANRPEKWQDRKSVDLSNKDGTLRQTINNFVSADVIDGNPKNDSEHLH